MRSIRNVVEPTLVYSGGGLPQRVKVLGQRRKIEDNQGLGDQEARE